MSITPDSAALIRPTGKTEPFPYVTIVSDKWRNLLRLPLVNKTAIVI